MIHLAYPNAVMNMVLLLAALILCAMAARNRTKNIYEADVTKGNINSTFNRGLKSKRPLLTRILFSLYLPFLKYFSCEEKSKKNVTQITICVTF